MRTHEDLSEEAAAVFATITVRYADQVYRHVRRSLANDTAAADVTQRVFVKAREELARGSRLPASLRAWVFAIAQQEAARRRSLNPHPDPGLPESGRAAAAASDVSPQPTAIAADGTPDSSDGGKAPTSGVGGPEALVSSGSDMLRGNEDGAAQQAPQPPPRIGRAEALPMGLAAVIAASLIVFMVWNAGREQQPPTRADDKQAVALAVETLPLPDSHQDVQPPQGTSGIQASEASVQISPVTRMSPASPAQNLAAAYPTVSAPEPTRAAPISEENTPLVRIRAPAGFTGANLRAEPSQQGRSLELLPDGTSLEVLQGAADADGFSWKRVRTMGGTVGWIVSTALT